VALRVAVLPTGGTIATRTDGSGTAVARTSGRELLGDLPLPAGVAVDAEDVCRVRSCTTTLDHLQQLAVRVDERLRDDVARPHRPRGTALRPRRRRRRAGGLHRVRGPDDSAT
jgi:L-asparaginase/Glu-tRNA(Gln) amidotransferase subunit D